MLFKLEQVQPRPLVYDSKRGGRISLVKGVGVSSNIDTAIIMEGEETIDSTISHGTNIRDEPIVKERKSKSSYCMTTVICGAVVGGVIGGIAGRPTSG